MAQRIVIETPARLHFGIVNPFGRDSRRYMSVGVAIDKPRTRVVVYPDKDLEITGCRASEVYSRVSKLIEEYGVKKGLVVIEECAPKHVGLGSTTQLLLAVSSGLLRANNVRVDIVEVARKLGLGSVSGVGTYVFKYGGFIVDAGISRSEVFPKLLLRLEMPENWRFIVIVPRGQGLSDEAEKAVFSSDIMIRQELPWRASYILFTRLIPSLIERDFSEFSQALRDLQVTVGEMFSGVQGGTFASSSANYVELLMKMGIVGVGQSSWGPTVYGLVESQIKALELEEKIKKIIGNKAEVFIATPRNRGATVRILC